MQTKEETNILLFQNSFDLPIIAFQEYGGSIDI